MHVRCLQSSVILTLFICQDFIIENVSFDISLLELVYFRVDELSEMLEVKKLAEKLLHIRT